MIFHSLKPGFLKRQGFRKYYNCLNQKEKKMFKNRLFSLIVAAVFVVAIALAVQRAFAAKATVPETNRAYTESNEWSLRVTSSLVEEDLASLSYLSRLNKCFDMPFSELASCRNALGERYGQTP
jgi:hypothetical protein